MNEQKIILFFMILSMGITIFLSNWKTKKEVEYKKDERWQLIKNKANDAANQSNYILVLVLAIGQIISINCAMEITITITRLFIYGMYFVGLRNAIELFALRYYDNQI